MPRAAAKAFTPAPGGPDMGLNEAFDRVFRLAEWAIGNRPAVSPRDAQAVDLIKALAVGSHFYQPEGTK